MTAAMIFWEDWDRFGATVILAVFEASRDSPVALDQRLKDGYPGDTVIDSHRANVLLGLGERVTRKRIESTFARLDVLVADFAAESWETAEETVGVLCPEQKWKFVSTPIVARAYPLSLNEEGVECSLDDIVRELRRESDIFFQLEISDYMQRITTLVRRWIKDVLK